MLDFLTLRQYIHTGIHSCEYTERQCYRDALEIRYNNIIYKSSFTVIYQGRITEGVGWGGGGGGLGGPGVQNPQPSFGGAQNLIKMGKTTGVVIE